MEETEEPTGPPVGTKGMLFVNAYGVTRHYGGPEEGGWWFNAGEPLASVPIAAEVKVGHGVALDGSTIRCWKCNDDEGTPDCGEVAMAPLDAGAMVKLVDQLREQFADEASGDIYSVLGGVKLEVSLECHFAAAWPSERPHYE